MNDSNKKGDIYDKFIDSGTNRSTDQFIQNYLLSQPAIYSSKRVNKAT